MHEIGLGVTGLNLIHGTPRNPCAPDHHTGGSSSGGSSSSAPFNTILVAWDSPSATGNEVYTFNNTKVYKSTNFGSSWSAPTVSPPPERQCCT